MADKLKPENADIVERIRKYEEQTFLQHDFKLYKNYHVPEKLVKESSRVLSFGVGADVNFEKLICLDNQNLDVRIFDPTPWTVRHIRGILNKSGYEVWKKLDNGNEMSKQIVQNNFTFTPYAYAPKNGKMKFYHKTKDVTTDPERVPGCLTLIDAYDDPDNHVVVKCRNIETILEELGWSGVDILKTDVEGLWYEVGKEIKDLDVKYWVTEIEMNLGMTYDEAFDKITELVELHKNKYNIYTNRRRLKPVMELIFCRKDIDES